MERGTPGNLSGKRKRRTKGASGTDRIRRALGLGYGAPVDEDAFFDALFDLENRRHLPDAPAAEDSIPAVVASGPGVPGWTNDDELDAAFDAF